MKTKIKQIEGLNEYINDNEYRTPTVVGTQIRLSNSSPSMTMKFYLSAPVTGGAITISTDGGATDVALKDGEGNAVTELTAGLKEVVYVTPFFILRSSGGLQEFFGDGSDGTIPNLNTVTTAPNGGTVANLWDMNAGTSFTTSSLGASANIEVFKLSFSTPQFIQNGAGINFYSAVASTTRTFALQSSDDGVSWTERGTVAISNTPLGQVVSGAGVSAKFWRLVTTAGTAGTVSFTGATINWKSGDVVTSIIWRILEPSTLNGAAVVKQYTEYVLPVGYEHTTQNPCQGLIIYSQGNATVNGILDMSQKAGLAPNGNAIPMLITKKAFKTAKTSSLLHFDNNITDDNGRVWTNNGAATFDATNKKFGTHAISFNGTNQWIDTPASDDFSFGSEDFTIEAWVRPTALGGNPKYIYADSNSTTGKISIALIIETTSVFKFTLYDKNNVAYVLLGTSTLLLNSYNHVCVCNINGVLKMFVNGVQEASVLFGVEKLTTQDKPTIGRQGTYSANYFQGQIDEFRIIKGKAMYTANFTPPTSAYVYKATYVDEPKTLEKYFQLTNVLQTLRGGYGGNGGYGGGYNGSTGRQTSVGIGGAVRQNLGGFGGGGSGGGSADAGLPGGIGGSILNAEIGGGRIASVGLNGTVAVSHSVNGINGSGAIGSAYSTSSRTLNGTGFAYGGGTGGTGGTSNGLPTATSDSQYAGGFLCLSSGGNITNSGTIRANGGAGSNGSAGAGTNTGGGGGGGGAGGGVIALFYGGTYANTGTVQVNGGAGGAGGAGVGTGEAGGSGTPGGVGTIHVQQI